MNTTADTAGPVGCPASCTIRNAIAAAAANGSTQDDTIVIPAGTYTLTAGLGSLAVPSSATRLTLQGAGANSTFIQAPADPTIRVLAVGSSAGVTIAGLTLRDGLVSSGSGGNLSVANQATVTLSRVRITNGRAPQGGGIAALGAASLTISQSLLDGNRATGTALADIGGGVYVQGQTSATAITVEDSTIAGNSARNGAGIGMVNNSGQPPALRGVTLVRNNARAGTGGAGVGGISSQHTNARFQGSIVAGNTSTINLGGGPVDVPANCGLASAALDDGGNVTPDPEDQCGLGGVHTNPQLAAALDTSQPPALSIPANSPAADMASCGTRTLDQRSVTRPQGTSCDAGAYEVDKEPTVTITSGPTGTVAVPTASFGFTTTEPGVAVQCRLVGPGQPGTFSACASPTAQSFNGLASGNYTFAVRALDGTFPNPPISTLSFVVDLGAPVISQQQPTPTPTPSPMPVAGKSVGARPVSGTILVKLPGSTKFVKLDPSVIKLGAEVDARDGAVEITRSDGGIATFYDGIFKLSESGGITTLTLTEKLTGCPKKAKASAAARKPRTRKLWGDGKGKFRTTGQ